MLAEIRRATVPTGVLVAGFFDGDVAAAFEHTVVPAWFWPVDEFSEPLRSAGFIGFERCQRPARDGRRAHAAIAALVE